MRCNAAVPVAIGTFSLLAAGCGERPLPLGPGPAGPASAEILEHEPDSGDVTDAVGEMSGSDFISYEYGLVIPTEPRQAVIEGAATEVELTCPGDDTCSATFTATHQGNWHWSEQTHDWSVTDMNSAVMLAGTQVTRKDGERCLQMAWIGWSYCAWREQKTVQPSGTIRTASCDVEARTTTSHAAGHHWLAGIGVGGAITLKAGRYGEIYRASNGADAYYDCADLDPNPSLCDDPVTKEVESCSDDPASDDPIYRGTSGTAPTGEATTSGFIEMVEICDLMHWWVSWDGGKTFTYVGFTNEGCYWVQAQ